MVSEVVSDVFQWGEIYIPLSSHPNPYIYMGLDDWIVG